MQQVKVITGVERRRRFDDAAKTRILEETMVPGASVIGVARKYDVSPSLIYGWRKSIRMQEDETIAPGNSSSFVQLIPTETTAAAEAEPAVIRIHLNAEIIVDFPVHLDPKRIAAVLHAVKG